MSGPAKGRFWFGRGLVSVFIHSAIPAWPRGWMAGRSLIAEGGVCQDGQEEGTGQLGSSQTPALTALGLLQGTGTTQEFKYTQAHPLFLMHTHLYIHARTHTCACAHS